MKKKVIFSVLVFISAMLMKGQEMWGVVNGNYAGINSTFINPASMLHSKLYLDVNLLTADVFFENNALYIHKEDYNPFTFLGSTDNFPKYGKDDMPFDYYRNSKRKNLYVSTLVEGPSFSIVKGIQAFGFRTGVRTIVSGRSVPYEIVPFSYEGLGYEPQHNINYNDDLISVASLSWFEIALSYARGIYRRGHDFISGGITARMLQGYAGAYLDIENLDYIVNNDSTLNIRNVRGEMGISTNDLPPGKIFGGTGFAFDLGLVYEKRTRGYTSWRAGKLCRQPYDDYQYRLGFSIIDLGWIGFNGNARKHSYNDVGVFWEHIDTVNFRNLDAFTAMVSEQLYGDPQASLTSTKIQIQLPTALSAQFDYHYLDQWYVNASVVVPLRLSKAYIQRPAQIAITPRYETQFLEISVPVSLYDFRYPRIGIAARFWFFTIGTDKLLGFMNLTDFTGMDLYFSIKFNFLKGKCRPSGFQCDRGRSWVK
ncbi:MAG TPA: DUF5723 family protein [Bacteroidales bacterium]|nr:DUF5723 family protein [Bacteroidales bacterium]